jgi:hypothetical protein
MEEVNFLEKGNFFPNSVENGVKSEVVGSFIEQQVGEDETRVSKDSEGGGCLFPWLYSGL